MSMVFHLLGDLLVPAALAVAVHFMEVADWDHGIARNAWLGGTTAAIAVLWLWRSRKTPAAPPRRYVLALCVVAGLLLGWRSTQSWENLGAVPLDIAFSTLDSIKSVVREHKDPYARPIDSRKEAPADAKGFRYYHGYKYLPGMMAIYAPFAVLFEFPGILFTNYLLFLATVVLIYLLAAAGGGSRPTTHDPRPPEAGYAIRGTRHADRKEATANSEFRIPNSDLQPTACNLQPSLSVPGLRGVILFLSLGVVPLEMFEKGVNDLAPMVPLMFALYAVSRGWMFAAGASLGFSVGSKLLPAAPVALMFLPLARSRWFVLPAVLTAAALCMPFLTWHPRQFIANVFLFNLDRPPDTTSVAYYLPLIWQKPWLYAGVAAVVAVLSVWFLKKQKDWRTLVFSAVVLVGALLVFGTMVHRNYLLWVIPLWCVILPRVAYPSTSNQ